VNIPVSPPDFSDLLQAYLSEPELTARFNAISRAGVGPAPHGKYRHWDTFRHALPLEGYSAELQWLSHYAT
jgi:hypothetical protein